MSDPNTRWLVHPDAESIAQAAAQRILVASRDAILRRGRFCMALGGGSTPKRTYELLSGMDTDWSRWQLYYGDERCLPVDDSERNSRMVEKAWLEKIAPAEVEHFPVPTEFGVEAGAQRYSRIVEAAMPLDLALLGLGEDGHTASLFPGHVHPDDVVACPVYEAPKPPAERISLSYKTLGLCREVLFLVAGEGKRDAVTAWRQDGQIPAAQIHCQAGVDILIDHAAMPDDANAG